MKCTPIKLSGSWFFEWIIILWVQQAARGAQVHKITNFLTRFKFSSSSIPLALFGICILAFGFMSPLVGFFGDEWHLVYEAIFRQTKGLAEFLYYDGHPLITWVYALSFRLLGIQPLTWHVYSLILRWLSVTGFWVLLNATWPERKLETFMAAVFFALHPVFELQMQAVSYFEIWISYIVLWISFYFSIKSIQKPDKFWQFTIVAILFKTGHIFTSEYTWGTEFMRWCLLGTILYNGSPQVKSIRLLVRKVFAISWPYLMITLLAYFWRIFSYTSPTGYRTDPVLIQQLVRNPLATISSVLNNILPDLIWILFTSWKKTVAPESFELVSLFNFLVFGIMLLSGLLTWLYTRKVFAKRGSQTDEQVDTRLTITGSSSEWTYTALISGAGTLMLGMLPFYATGNFIHLGFDPWQGRFALGSLPGVALLMAVFFSAFIRPLKQKFLLFAVLTGLMIGWQNQAADQFRRIWLHQEQFYQQLLWRAPAIERDTALIIGEGNFKLPAALAFELSTVYEEAALPDGRMAYWFFHLPSDQIERGEYINELAKGLPLNGGKYANYFSGDSRQSILFTFSPEKDQCLWILTPEMANYASAQLQPLSLINAFDRIIPEQPGEKTQSGKSIRPFRLFDAIYGSTRAGGRQTWCYYFEKADLARQMRDWAGVDLLWGQATKNNLKPSNAMEYLPFIEAYAQSGQWDLAMALTRSANRLSPDSSAAMCKFWERIKQETPGSDNRTTTINQVNNALECNPAIDPQG